MAEQFLTLMAEFDEGTQMLMGNWYEQLKAEGFVGKQTPDLPIHISLATFALDKEEEVINEMKRLAKEFSMIPVHISHIGIFPGGKVLFGAPDMSMPQLVSLRESIKVSTSEVFPWTPHATILIDEPEVITKALPVLINSFHPIVGQIKRLHLCAFWPTREVFAIELGGTQ